MHGFLIVDKPEGVTSAEVVRRVKRQLQVKVGHLGTLDPFATGVLPLCLGEATKIAQFLNTADKQYEGLIRLGTATDTGDRTGKVIRTAAVPATDEIALRQITRQFTGDYLQVPPMYSALKQRGVPLYRLARQGIEVKRPSRQVRVVSLHLTIAEPGCLRFQMRCSKGTYVRVLAEDIGVALGSAAHVQALRRTRFGDFDVSQTVDLTTWRVGGPSTYVSIREALAHLPRVQLTHQAAEAARHGQGWVLAQVPLETEGDLAVLVDPSERVTAVVAKRRERWGFARVLHDPAPIQA